MFAPPQLIETEVFAAVPQNLRKSHVPAERIAAGAAEFRRAVFSKGRRSTAPAISMSSTFLDGRDFSISPQGKFDVVAEYDGEPNGLRIHKDGRIFVADHKIGIVLLDPATGAITPFVTRYHREHFKGVNDLTFASNGDLYFTDQGQSDMRSDGPGVSVYRGRRAAKARRLRCRVRKWARAQREGRHAVRRRDARECRCGAFRWHPTARSHAWACTSRCRAAAAPMA